MSVRPAHAGVRFAALALVLLLLPLPAAPATAAAPPCADALFMKGVGNVCPRTGGLFEVFTEAWESLGFTHGPDPAPRDPSGGATLPLPGLLGGVDAVADVGPFCASGDYTIRVIYARAHDDADRYASMVGTLRSMVFSANQRLQSSAVATGGDDPQLRVRCDGDGNVRIEEAVLPTSKGRASFGTITQDLRNMGYTSGRVKHWVFYDDTGACGCGGVGHIYGDDRQGRENLNNGNGGALFSVTFGYTGSFGVKVMLHELGHNMGAVQNSAPHASGGFHCWDGRDVMCYNDGGPNGWRYTSRVCGGEPFDCRNDDYCHGNPAPGSYLATRWNVCGTNNRFLEFHPPPVMAVLSCPSAGETLELVPCTLGATTKEDGVAYRVDWGDGTVDRVPATGHARPGDLLSTTHVYEAPGATRIRVVPVDDDGREGAAREVAIDVAERTRMTRLDCPSPARVDRAAACTFEAASSTTGVRYRVEWGDGTPADRLPEWAPADPGAAQTATHAYAATGTYEVRVEATDDATPAYTSRPLTSSLRLVEPPVLSAVDCPAKADVANDVACTLRATDADSSGVRFRVDWGDGRSTVEPGSGLAAPDADVPAAHRYREPGVYAVTVTPEDDTGVQGDPWTVSVRVYLDATPPALDLEAPAPGVAYVGCEPRTPAPPAQGDAPATAPPLFVGDGCVVAHVRDAESGIARVRVLLDGRVVGDVVLRAAPEEGAWQFTFPVPAIRADADLRIEAADHAGNVAHRSVTVATLAATGP